VAPQELDQLWHLSVVLESEFLVRILAVADGVQRSQNFYALVVVG
jgi:hypothetical protein